MDGARPVRVTVIRSSPRHRHRLTSTPTTTSRPTAQHPPPAPPATTISLLSRSYQSNAQTSISSIPREGVRSFVKSVISPFVNCVQPPLQACVAPATQCWVHPLQQHSTPVRYKNRRYPNGLYAITPLSRPPSRTNSACDPPGYAYAPASALAASFPQKFPYHQSVTSQRRTLSPPAEPTVIESFRIAQPGEKDVLCGANSRRNDHFETLVSANQSAYRCLSEDKKGLMARQLVDTVVSAGGRFLAKDDISGLWYDIGWSRSCKKASQSLAESSDMASSGKTADYKANDNCSTRKALARQVASPLRSLASSNNSISSNSNSNRISFKRDAASSHDRLVQLPRIIIPRHLENTYRSQPQGARRSPSSVPRYHRGYHTRQTVALPPTPNDHPGYQLALLYDYESRLQHDPPSRYGAPDEGMGDNETPAIQNFENPQQQSTRPPTVQSQRTQSSSTIPTSRHSRYPKAPITSYPKLPLPEKTQHSNNRTEQLTTEPSPLPSQRQERAEERSSLKRPRASVRKKEETNVVPTAASPTSTFTTTRNTNHQEGGVGERELPQKQPQQGPAREMMAPSILLQSRSYGRLGRLGGRQATQSPQLSPVLSSMSCTSSEDPLFKSDTVSHPTATTTGAFWRLNQN